MQSLNSGTGNNESIDSMDHLDARAIVATNESDVASLDVERHGEDSAAACHDDPAQQDNGDEVNDSASDWRSISSTPSGVWASFSRRVYQEAMSIGSISFADSVRSRAPDGTIRHSRVFSSQALREATTLTRRNNHQQSLDPQNLPALDEATPHSSRSTSARPSDSSSRVEWVEGPGSSHPPPNHRGSINGWHQIDQYVPQPDIDFVAEATLVVEDTEVQDSQTNISSHGDDTFVQMDRAYDRLDGVRRSDAQGSIGVRAERLMSGRLVDAHSISNEDDFNAFVERARNNGAEEQQPPTYDQVARALLAIGGNVTDHPTSAPSINRLSSLVDGQPEYWLSSLVNGAEQDQQGRVEEREEEAYIDDATLSTRFPIRDIEVQDEEIAEAEPLHNKFIISRKVTAIVAATLVMLIVALAVGISLPPSSNDTENTISYGKSYEDDDVITYAPEDICFSLLPMMSNHSLACPDPTNQLTKGGPVCQLVANALLYADHPSEVRSKVDVSLINGGAIRGDIFRCNVTAGIIREEILPFFGNRVVYLTVSPAEIYQTLNSALVDTGRIFTTAEQEMFFPEAKALNYRWAYESSYPYAAGLRFDVDLNAPDGEKVTNIIMNVGESANPEWKLLDPNDHNATIRAVTADFLAGGGDGYFPGVSTERHEIKEDLSIKDLFLLYAAGQDELIGPTVNEMSTRHFVPLNGYNSD